MSFEYAPKTARNEVDAVTVSRPWKSGLEVLRS